MVADAASAARGKPSPAASARNAGGNEASNHKLSGRGVVVGLGVGGGEGLCATLGELSAAGLHAARKKAMRRNNDVFFMGWLNNLRGC
jgi:hypothetical protein